MITFRERRRSRWEHLVKRLLHPVLIIVALASGSPFVPANSVPDLDRSALQINLNGEIENNDGRICISLTNNSDNPIEGIAVVAIGSDADQFELGQFSFHLEARSGGYFRIKTAGSPGDYYRLRILSPEGKLLLYRAAPIKRVSDASPALEVTLTAAAGKTAEINTRITAEHPAQPETTTALPEAASQDVSVKAQLLGSPVDPASFAVFFELRSRRPISQATLSITAGKFSDSRPVSLGPAATVQFQLPGKDSDSGEFERIEYTLTEKDGRQLARGTLEIDQLMADDVITVLDVRTHRPSYTTGETARLTVLLEGQSRNGYRLEVLVRDYNGLKLFLDQRNGDGQTALTPQEFIFILPTDAQKPLIFEYKIYNPESGLLFDSGEFEIPVEDKTG